MENQSGRNSSFSNDLIARINDSDNQIIGSLERLSKLADKGPTITMLVLGGFLIVSSLSLKVVSGIKTLQILTPIEFISMIFFGTILLFGGGAIRYFSNKRKEELIKENHKIGGQLMSRVADVGANLLERRSDPEPD